MATSWQFVPCWSITVGESVH